MDVNNKGRSFLSAMHIAWLAIKSIGKMVVSCCVVLGCSIEQRKVVKKFVQDSKHCEQG